MIFEDSLNGISQFAGCLAYEYSGLFGGYSVNPLEAYLNGTVTLGASNNITYILDPSQKFGALSLASPLPFYLGYVDLSIWANGALTANWKVEIWSSGPSGLLSSSLLIDSATNVTAAALGTTPILWFQSQREMAFTAFYVRVITDAGGAVNSLGINFRFTGRKISSL